MREQEHGKPLENDTQWQAWAEDWQSHQDEWKALRRKLPWLNWRMRLVIILDMLAILVFLWFSVDWLQGRSDAGSWLLLSLLWVAIIAGVSFDIWVRRGLWSEPDEDSISLLIHLQQRARAGQLIGRFSWITALAIIPVYVALVTMWKESGVWGDYLSWLPLVVWLAVAGWGRWYESRQQHRQQALSLALSQARESPAPQHE